ncbi:multidrug resistance protein-like protein [Hortaea werneckii]|nr:multidrug resistance protein-like protein [Hortaea werneckii]KAI6987037.1 multidrug resistance protein-like protein [Hortaea werneckii]KAI7141231.1 multidrug resistance protein-like protein [Hortaea werneckii]KAI7167921.1 multidrug resistance protein-like protein [Hortaea werneckii]KAI7504196.1 multidrug resistance protein-like protein [Hortaea werneckii]
MAELFEDTTFGQIVRWASGGKLFAHRDDWDEELRQHYIVGSQEKQRRSSDELEKGKGDYVLIDFLEDDPKNPRNWTVAKKAFVTFNICLLTFSIYIGSAIYTSGLRDITREFAVSQTVAVLGLTLYVLGYGIGPMIFAPLSEIPFVGRNKIYLGTLLVFVFFNFGVVYAQNIGMLLAFRFLTGFFGSPVLATGGASLADMYRPAKRAYPFAIYGIANVAGPTVGPVVGNWAAEFKGWTWPIWILIWASGFALVFLFFFFPETSANYILCRRTARLRKHQPQDGLKFKCQPEIMGEQMTPAAAMKMTLVKPFTLCFGEPIVFALNLYIALIYAVLYCWLESIPIVFEQARGFSLGISGLCYIGLIVGGLLTIPPYFYYNYYFVEPRFDDEGNIKPEIRLETALVGCFCLPICLFLFGWTGSDTSIHWIVPIIGTTFFTIGAFCSFAAVLNYLGDSYPADFASISAGNDFFRSCFGAAFPLFATQMFTTLGIDWGNSLLGFLTICFIPIIFGLWWKGDRLRMRSNNARHDI